MGRPEPQITREALARLRDFPWPGNVRQLQNAIEYAVVLAKENTIAEESLPTELLLPPMLRDQITVFSSAAGHGTPAAPGVPDLDSSLNLDDRERQAILQALAQTHGNKLKAAKILGIHRPTLYNKMKRYGIAV